MTYLMALTIAAIVAGAILNAEQRGRADGAKAPLKTLGSCMTTLNRQDAVITTQAETITRQSELLKKLADKDGLLWTSR